MDLLVEKGDKRTYLSRYKVITTSFEESAPSVKRNNTQIQYRNGNVDFGGWNEVKTIDYVGYYRADDLEDEEYLRERIYALLSDHNGYYITQLKNDNDNSFERPGETSGDYFDKQVNRPSHKRFYVYASSLESELVGSYGGHVLYKISATFTTMKLPYGESVPRDLEVKPNVPYMGTNLLIGTATPASITGNNSSNQGKNTYSLVGGMSAYALYQKYGSTFTLSYDWSVTDTASAYKGAMRQQFNNNPYSPGALNDFTIISSSNVSGHKVATFTLSNNSGNIATGFQFHLDNVPTTSTITVSNMKLEKGSVATDWSPAPEDPVYNEWYLDTYYNTDNLVIPYAGTVPCSQLEQGFVVEFTAKEGGSGLKVNLNGTELIYSGQIYSGDVIKLSGYEYTKNEISVVKYTNKAYFKLFPGVANKISSSISGAIRILGYQDLYA